MVITSEDFILQPKIPRIKLSNTNIIDIISVVDSDGNNWNEVDSTQDMHLTKWKIIQTTTQNY